MKIYIDPGYPSLTRRIVNEVYIDDDFALTRDIAENLAVILRSNGLDVMVSCPTLGTKLVPGRSNTVAERVTEANNWGADYYIILQLNLSDDPFTTGSEAYVKNINSPSKLLADLVLERLNLSTNLQNRGVSTRPDLLFLSKPYMPSVLIGLGCSTNEGDAKLLIENPELFTNGVANGILAYLQGFTNTSSMIKGVRESFYQIYPESRTGSCRLDIDICSENKKRRPLSDAVVTVYQGAGGKRLLVYRGCTNKYGRIIPVDLPLYNNPESCYDIQPLMYCICVKHPEYFSKNLWVTVTDQKTISHNIALKEKFIKQR